MYLGICKNVTMVPLKVFNNRGEGSAAYVAKAINYAINNNISILNYSGGGNSRNNNLYNALNNYKGIFITSAGNGSLVDGAYIGYDTDNTPHYPSGYDCNNIIAVASTDSNDNKAVSSNYGRTTIDLGAPGENINSTVINNSYEYKSGTSMAAPQVTGTVALLKSYFPGATTEQLKWAILQGVDAISSLSGKTVSGGRLNAYNSFLKLMDYQFVQDRVVAGDFNGDGKDDIAGLYYYDLDTTKIKVWLSNGRGLNKPEDWYKTASQNYNANSVNGRVMAGDFNGDGKDDIAAIYDYGDSKTAIHIWKSNGSGFDETQTWFYSNQYNAENITERVTVGDFNGDGKDDIVSMYDYGNNTIILHVWISTGNIFRDISHWYNSESGNYIASNATGRMTAGDFNGDGKDDICVMYDYGNLNAGLQVWKSTGNKFSDIQLWHVTGTGNYDADSVNGRVTAGDFNGDGKQDVTTMYDYGNNRIAYHMGISTGNNFSGLNSWFDSGSGSYSAEKVGSRMISGDFNGDGKDDAATMYDYGQLVISIHTWKSSGNTLLEMEEWYRSGIDGT